MEQSDHTDLELLSQLQAGDEVAFTLLYHRRQPAVYRFALQMSGSTMIAEDVAQVETWYSQDLKMTVLSETSDPRSGTSSMKLTNVSRAEPSRSLFEVPVGSTLTEGQANVSFEPGQRIQIIRKELEKK